jgi:hypothetical protein
VVRTVNLSTDIPLSRELHITLPPDVPVGPAEIVVVVSPGGSERCLTLGELATSEFFGLWKERDDVSDSLLFAQTLRAEAWKRSV